LPKLIPVPDELSQPFWDACNERKLVVQNCLGCNTLNFPPRPRCSECDSDRLEWKETSGKGHILSFFVTYDGRYQRRMVDQPYNVAVVTLDEDPGINFYANLDENTAVREVPIGSAVEVFFEQVTPDQMVPDWRLV
jgi:uncharacterized OB-fold protein